MKTYVGEKEYLCVPVHVDQRNKNCISFYFYLLLASKQTAIGMAGISS